MYLATNLLVKEAELTEENQKLKQVIGSSKPSSLLRSFLTQISYFETYLAIINISILIELL